MTQTAEEANAIYATYITTAFPPSHVPAAMDEASRSMWESAMNWWYGGQTALSTVTTQTVALGEQAPDPNLWQAAPWVVGPNGGVYQVPAAPPVAQPTGSTQPLKPRTIHDCVDRFTHNLKMLTNDLHRRCPQDATVYRAKQRIMTGIGTDPLNVVNIVGPYLLQYQKEIDSFSPEVETFFLENTFDEELRASVNQEKKDLAMYIIPKVKELARGLPFPEKQARITLVSEMLTDYIEVQLLLAESRQ